MKKTTLQRKRITSSFDQLIHGETTSNADEVLQPNAKPDIETNEGTADEQERMTHVNTDQTDNPHPIYVFNMFIKKEEVDEENNSIEEENYQQF